MQTRRKKRGKKNRHVECTTKWHHLQRHQNIVYDRFQSINFPFFLHMHLKFCMQRDFIFVYAKYNLDHFKFTVKDLWI